MSLWTRGPGPWPRYHVREEGVVVGPDVVDPVCAVRLPKSVKDGGHVHALLMDRLLVGSYINLLRPVHPPCPGHAREGLSWTCHPRLAPASRSSHVVHLGIQ